MEGYKCPAASGESKLTEKKSVFIAHLLPIESEHEALDFIEQMRKKYYDARHNVYAYHVREGGIMRYTDDGEPSGTAGQPVLNVFRAQGIENFCCVVTRYFGGILLGTGGLVRAYSGAAQQVLKETGIMQMALWKSIELTCSYSQFERVRRLLESHNAVIENNDFGTDVSFSALLRDDVYAPFSDELTQITAGSVSCSCTGTVFRGVVI